MENYAIIDFETRSKLPLKKVGVFKYAKSAEVICMGLKFKDRHTEIYRWDKAEPICKKLLKFSKRYPIIAHNAVFDFLIFQQLTKCPDETLSSFLCTSLLSSFFGGPASLEFAAKFWKLDYKKDPKGKTLLKILTEPAKGLNLRYYEHLDLKKLKDEEYVEHPFLFKQLENYCKTDVDVTASLFEKLKPGLKHYNRHKVHEDFYLNFLRNKKGILFDLSSIERIVTTIQALKLRYERKIRKITGLPKFNISSPVQCMDYLKKKIKNPTNSSSAYLMRLFKRVKDKKLKLFLAYKLDYPKNILKKYTDILNFSERGVIFDNFKLFGSGNTGRFTSKGVNILNFPRSGDLDFDKTLQSITTMKGFKYPIFKKLMRQTIIAGEGHEFYGGDFSQIEFRLLMLVVGHFSILKKLYGNWDAYVHIARLLYSKEEISKEERYIAKRATLAFGYGLGKDYLCSLLLQDDIKLSLEDAARLHRIYHRTFPKVRRYWDSIYAKFVQARGRKITIPYSNRTIFFYRSRKADDGWEILSPNTLVYSRIWSSKLTALVVQGLAADVFRAAVRRLYAKLHMTVDIPYHDEVVCRVEKGTVNFKRFKEVLSQCPSFLPKKHMLFGIESDCWRNDRYVKL